MQASWRVAMTASSQAEASVREVEGEPQAPGPGVAADDGAEEDQAGFGLAMRRHALEQLLGVVEPVGVPDHRDRALPRLADRADQLVGDALEGALVGPDLVV